MSWLAEPQPARDRTGRPRAAGATGVGADRGDVVGAGANPGPHRRAGRPRGGRLHFLENLNTAVDHPGTPFARAADTRALVSAVDSPHLRMNLDLYHAQIGEGNLTELVRDSIDLVGETRWPTCPGVANRAPERSTTPDRGHQLRRVGYTGVVGLEAWASADSDLALERFRDALREGAPEPSVPRRPLRSVRGGPLTAQRATYRGRCRGGRLDGAHPLTRLSARASSLPGPRCPAGSRCGRRPGRRPARGRHGPLEYAAGYAGWQELRPTPASSWSASRRHRSCTPDRRGGRAGRQAPVDREAGRALPRGHRTRGGSSGGGRREGAGRLQLSARAGRGEGPSDAGRRCDRPSHARSLPDVHRLCRAPSRRLVVAVRG